MRLLTDDHDSTEPRYEIIVRTSTGEETSYRTVKLLYAATGHLLGHGTRVWEAVQLVDGEPTGDAVVLKDSWVDEDRQREGSNFERVREAAGVKGLGHIIETAFVAVKCFGDAFIDIKEPGENQVDSTRMNIRGHDLQTGAQRLTAAAKNIHHRIHHRTVLAEVCSPLLLNNSLDQVFEALGQICTGESPQNWTERIFQLIFLSARSHAPVGLGPSRRQSREYPD